MKFTVYFLGFIIFSLNVHSKVTTINPVDGEKCKLFLKQTDSSVYQEVKCTTKKRYPIPEVGYDKEHCITYRVQHFERKVEKVSGLYCSMDGYKGFKWYYVK